MLQFFEGLGIFDMAIIWLTRLQDLCEIVFWLILFLKVCQTHALPYYYCFNAYDYLDDIKTPILLVVWQKYDLIKMSCWSLLLMMPVALCRWYQWLVHRMYSTYLTRYQLRGGSSGHKDTSISRNQSSLGSRKIIIMQFMQQVHLFLQSTS